MGARLGRRARPDAGLEGGAAAGCGPAPYERRVRWLREIQSTLRERRPERARQLLRLLCQDLGLEGTLLTDILYRNVAYLNLVDPISHDLLVNLARDLQCPKSDHKLWNSSDRICQQLIYHLTPHSRRQQGSGPPQRKTQISSLPTLDDICPQTLKVTAWRDSHQDSVGTWAGCRQASPGRVQAAAAGLNLPASQMDAREALAELEHKTAREEFPCGSAVNKFD